MRTRPKRTQILVTGVLAFVVAPVLVVLSVLIGARDGNDMAVVSRSTAPVARVVPTPTTAVLGDELLGADGSALSMVDRHQPMMDQMRVSATPQMLQLMDTDPMWEMMRSGAYVSVLEEHESDIDRMLARGR